MLFFFILIFFFFQAEDGIRDLTVTGVQTCALPILRERIPELAVLKTLGFSDRSVLGFVLAEAFALCLAGGLVGLSLASLAGAMVEKGTGGQYQLHLDGSVWLLGVLA